MKNKINFAIALTCFSPLFIFEDALKFCGVPISNHGITKDENGKGIFDIWNESISLKKNQIEETKKNNWGW